MYGCLCCYTTIAGPSTWSKLGVVNWDADGWDADNWDKHGVKTLTGMEVRALLEMKTLLLAEVLLDTVVHQLAAAGVRAPLLSHKRDHHHLLHWNHPLCHLLLFSID